MIIQSNILVIRLALYRYWTLLLRSFHLFFSVLQLNLDLDPEEFNQQSFKIDPHRENNSALKGSAEDEYDHDATLDAAQFVNSAEPETRVELVSQETPPGISSEFLQKFKDEVYSHKDCENEGGEQLAWGFKCMEKAERVYFVRTILFAVTSHYKKPKMLYRDAKLSSRRKRKSGEEETLGGNKITVTVYCINGQRVSLQCFAAIKKLPSQVICRYARLFILEPIPRVYRTKTSNSRKGKTGFQRVVVLTFLMSVANDFGMECPRGCGSKEESPLRLQPSSFTKTAMLASYKKEWNEVSDAYLETRPDLNRPRFPVSFNLFIRYWQQDMPTLRIARKGSDFCNLCTSIKTL